METLAALEASVRSETNQVAKLLKKKRKKIVFAESCTCGKVAALLGEIPGISNYLCGSFVTYRNDSKTKWLGISKQTIRKHNVVSAEVARQMSLRSLRKTPEAHISASITGHLGPKAPKKMDGLVFVGVSFRHTQSDNRPFTVVQEMNIKTSPVLKTLKSRSTNARQKTLSRSHGSRLTRIEMIRIQNQLLASHSLLAMVRSLLSK